jgi:hypothetical protein
MKADNIISINHIVQQLMMEKLNLQEKKLQPQGHCYFFLPFEIKENYYETEVNQ